MLPRRQFAVAAATPPCSSNTGENPSSVECRLPSDGGLDRTGLLELPTEGKYDWTGDDERRREGDGNGTSRGESKDAWRLENDGLRRGGDGRRAGCGCCVWERFPGSMKERKKVEGQQRHKDESSEIKIETQGRECGGVVVF